MPCRKKNRNCLIWILVWFSLLILSLDHSHSANPCPSDISRPENPRSGICSGVHTQFLANSVWDNGTFCKHAKQMSPPKAPKWAKDPPNRPWLTWVHFWGPWLMGLKGAQKPQFYIVLHPWPSRIVLVQNGLNRCPTDNFPYQIYQTHIPNQTYQKKG